jgi:CheY-like chemotaxis protein
MNTSINRVLVVEPDPITRFLTERVLRRTLVGTELIPASTGQEGLDLLANKAQPLPELLLLSQTKPLYSEMSTREFIREFHLRFPQQTSVIAILAISIDAANLDLLRQTHVGPVFDKPLKDEEVHQLLHEYFPQTSRQGELAVASMPTR